MPTLRRGDADLHYEDVGSGTDAVLLLHAFPLHSGMWAPQLAALAGRFRVVALDYRGLGQSRPAPDATTMDLVAGDVQALLRQLGLRRVSVAGLSMGGYVALELYRRAPEIFRALALCATKATPDSEDAKATREAFAANAVAKGLGWVAEEFTPKLLKPHADPAVYAKVRDLIRSGTAEGVAAAQRGMARRPDSVPTLARISCPTAVLFGEEDQLIPFAEAQRMGQTVKGAHMVRIPGAGHLVNLENAPAFNAALSTFFAALQP
ncbi:MAG: alpha/beta fold hydrolase [Anaeromyxobacteraceae bacterium]